ncbi:MAG: hypothetical protein LBS67_07205 [Clostridiales Family XIII bacterium]|nr:hypothetical protein [Clostridiales Family XIII bacterium]
MNKIIGMLVLIVIVTATLIFARALIVPLAGEDFDPAPVAAVMAVAGGLTLIMLIRHRDV